MSTDNQDPKATDAPALSDVDLGALGAAWRSQTPDVKVDFSAARRQQQRRRLWFALDIGQALLLLVSSIGFLLFLPTTLITLIASPVLFLSALLVGYHAFSIHRQVLDYTDWTTSGLLTFRCMNHRASIKHLRINQLGCLITLGFTLALILLDQFRLAPIPDLLLTVFVYLALPVLLLLGYFQRRLRHCQRLLAQAEKLKAEFDL